MKKLIIFLSVLGFYIISFNLVNSVLFYNLVNLNTGLNISFYYLSIKEIYIMYTKLHASGILSNPSYLAIYLGIPNAMWFFCICVVCAMVNPKVVEKEKIHE